MPDGTPQVFRRVLLKISGEALMGDRSYGLDPNYVARVADEVKSVMELGAQVCLVVGGGNIFRGVSGAAEGMERATGDQMGMLATVINALAMRSCVAGYRRRVPRDVLPFL
jgi:uridylate kinase